MYSCARFRVVICAIAAANVIAAVHSPLLASDGYYLSGGERRSLERSTWQPRQSPEQPQYRTRPGIWQGFYVGLDGGAGWGKFDPSTTYDSIGASGGQFGVHAGYNWQHQQLVIGIEGDLGWSGMQGARTFEDATRLEFSGNWLSSARLRAGVAFDNLLVYATGGFALAGLDLDVRTPATHYGTTDAFLGYAIGAGIEMKIAPNLSGRVEALHYGFGDKTFETATGSLSGDFSATTLRAGLTYHFDAH